MRLAFPQFAIYASLLIATPAFAARSIPEPPMAIVPQGGITTLACPKDGVLCPEHEYAKRQVSIASFELGTTEVTFAEWDACVEDGSCASEKSDWAFLNRPVHPPCAPNEACQYPFDEGWGRDWRPVIHVSWDDVQQYIAWLNRKTGKSYRLPTAQEWEYAALAGASTTFDWGNAIGKNKTNCDGCGSKWDGRQTAPVASFKANRFGMYDMTGNVSEWTSSCFPTRERSSHTCMTYIYKGGAWSYPVKSMDPRLYGSADGHTRENFLGFRLARTLDKASR